VSKDVHANPSAELRSIAKEKNVSVDELLAAHIPGLGTIDSPKTGRVSNKVKALKLWVKSFPKDSAAF
jgi:hypothetical protein